MNDPGLHEPIQHTANHVTSQLRDNMDGSKPPAEPETVKEAWVREIQEDEDEEEVGFYTPRRWWFTSTAFPLIAGTFGPIGNLFSVCALVQTWRVQLPEGERIPDPVWLTVLNALSLTSSLSGNLFLLFNFAHRVRYPIAQPLTIGLWYTAAIFLLIPLGLTSKLVIEPTSSHAFSQSYYYGMICVVIYLVLSTLLVFNCLGAYIFKAYPPSFNSLTIPQRTLMLQTIAYVLYLAIGAGIFARVEGWSFVDAVYWADYTLLTIGIGSDFSLQTNVGKGLLIPYAVIGIMMIGLIVGSIRGLVLERGQLKVIRRQLGKERQKLEWRKGKSNGEKPEVWGQSRFEEMRKIEKRAERMRKYTALAVALLAYVIVWFMGALVFWFSEKPQEWTYFQSLYFSYVSLTTIGYGDYYPQSDSGKPFFVIWSLIAVPTVTILISSIGDSVVAGLRDGILWLGQRTILPEGTRLRSNTLQGFKEALGREAEREEEHEGGEEELRGDIEKLGTAVERAEDKRDSEPGRIGATIAREIKNLAKDIGIKPPRRYSWEEWKKWIDLLEIEGGGDSADGVWLADDGPLFSQETETQWILARLCERLERVLSEELEKDRQNGRTVQEDK